jgi:citronellol/citronellal dehydrogenase
MATLRGRTLFITGASRGIGLSIGLRAAQDGANVVIAAKTTDPHPKLPGTIYSAAEAVEKAGGKALPLAVDIRDENAVAAAVAQAAEKFGGIDILVNNASAIFLAKTTDVPMKRYDLMHQVNARGTFVCSQACIPYLKKGTNPHILNISPPLNMKAKWFQDHCAYTMAKYGMSMCVLGMSGELAEFGIGVNALWPRTCIDTAAINMLGGDPLRRQSRKPEIMADAAHLVLTSDSKKTTGEFFIDDEVLASHGITDLDGYAVEPGQTLLPDFFLD